MIQLDCNMKEIINSFDLGNGEDVEIVNIRPIFVGNINETFCVTIDTNGQKYDYLLQRINHHVFQNPNEVMENIWKILGFLDMTENAQSKKIALDHLHLYRVRGNGYCYHKNVNGEDFYYRMYDYKEGKKTFDKPRDTQMVSELGHAFGDFLKKFEGFPVASLAYTISNFHNTIACYRTFEKAVAENRAHIPMHEELEEMIQYIKSEKDWYSLIWPRLGTKEFPLRVTHNDTKINNVMFEERPNGDVKAVCVIDLDTVMPGSMLFDFADALRSCANRVDEKESDMSKVQFDLSYFEAFAKSYLKETWDILTPFEIDFLAPSCYIITMELAMRFLGDYMDGSTYFKPSETDPSNINYIRAKNQLTLAHDIKRKLPQMTTIIQNIVTEYRKEKVEIQKRKSFH